MADKPPADALAAAAPEMFELLELLLIYLGDPEDSAVPEVDRAAKLVARLKGRKVNVSVEEKDERYSGEPTGRRVFHTMETAPFSRIFRGCPLGRGYTEKESLEDFVRRANADDADLKLEARELVVTERRTRPEGQ